MLLGELVVPRHEGGESWMRIVLVCGEEVVQAQGFCRGGRCGAHRERKGGSVTEEAVVVRICVGEGWDAGDDGCCSCNRRETKLALSLPPSPSSS